MASIVTVGSMAFDSIQTPFGSEEKVLGGSANHFSVSASYFAPVKCISVVGEDFPKQQFDFLQGRGVDVSGVKVEKGLTFHWSGRYGYDLHEAETLATDLNVFRSFAPEIPASYASSEFLFLGNIMPSLQDYVLSKIHQPKFVALDSMNYWIEGQRDALISVIKKTNAVIINEAELRQLTKTYNLVQAAQTVRAWGPQVLVVKRGEYGAVLFDHGDAFSIPGLPLAEIKDPTGAGDSFAGGFMGYLASQTDLSLSRATLRKAIVYGSVMASFIVQDFGFRRLTNLTRQDIDERYQRFVELTAFHLE